MIIDKLMQDSIKVGLAVSLSVVLSLWIGWENAYWAAMTVFVIAATESFSHALQKSSNRLIGTLVGVTFAILLPALAAQDRELFIFLYSILLFICVYFTSHKRYGYAFNIVFFVCAIVICSGGFDGTLTFHLAILRIQQTVLGIFVYSFIFQFVWHKNNEALFFNLLQQVTHTQKQHTLQLKIADSVIDEAETWQQANQIAKLREILSLPLKGNYRLHKQRKIWLLIVVAIDTNEKLIALMKQGDSSLLMKIEEGEYLISESLQSVESQHQALRTWLASIELTAKIPPTTSGHFAFPNSKRLSNGFKALAIFLTCMAMWIYIPLPGGPIMPMIVSIFACAVVSLPDIALRHAGYGTLIWGVIFTTEYVLLLPMFTEVWQLAMLLFINSVILWRVCSHPRLALQKVIGGAFSVLLLMGALQLTPVYSIVQSMLMVMLILICLAVATFYTRLFSTKP